MTRPELNSFVDTNVTNKTAPLSLTPSEEGAAIKKVADYVDDNFAPKNNPTFTGTVSGVTKAMVGLSNVENLRTFVKVSKTTITEAQILQLFSTPIEILDSSESGITRIPTNIFCKRNGVGTNYTFATNQFSLKISSGSTLTMSLLNTILTSTDEICYTNLSYNYSGTESQTYSLSCYSSNPTGGTGDMDVYVTYIELIL